MIIILCNLQRIAEAENSQQQQTTSLLVANRKETTRSHPEHGRKDLQRRKYLAGHRLGR